MGQSLHAFSVGSQFEAQIARDYLADNGIMCVVRCDEIPLQPGFSFGLEGWGSLLVPVQDAPKARELLALIPGVGQGEDEDSGKVDEVSGAFRIKLTSVVGATIICLLWPIAWHIAVWYLLPSTGWGADDNQPDTLWEIAILLTNLGGAGLIYFIIVLTNGKVFARELPRAALAFLAAIALALCSPIWLSPILLRWSKKAFFRLRKTFNWLANLPEHLGD